MLLAGAAAWLVLNATVYILAPVLGVSLDQVARFFGSLLAPGAATTAQMWVGRAVLLAAAIGWSLLYPSAAQHLPGAGWLRGVVYGAGIWLVTALALPLIGAIHPNPGAFPPVPGAAGVAFPGFLGVGFAGTSGLILSILAHLAFGATLGVLLGMRERRAA